MKGLRIKHVSGKSSFDVDLCKEDLNCLKLTIKEWLSDGDTIASINLDLEQADRLFDFLKSFLSERKELLELQQANVRQTRNVLIDIYHESNKSGLVTFEHIKSLSQIKTPIIALLAKDLHVPASEIPLILENTPLPFALLKKHFKACWEAVLTEPCPVYLAV